MESVPPHVRNFGRKDGELSMGVLMLLLGGTVDDEGPRGIQSLLLGGLFVEFIGPCSSSGEGRSNDCDCCDDDGADCCCCCICCCCWAAWIDCNEGKEGLLLPEDLSGDS